MLPSPNFFYSRPMRSLLVLFLIFSAPLAAAEGPADLARRWMVYGQGLAAQGKQAEAGAAFDKALQLQPGDAALLRARGQWHWSQGLREQALSDLRGSLQADPSQAALKAWLERSQAPAAAPSAGPQDDEALAEAQALLESRDFAGVLELQQGQGEAAQGSAAWLRLRSEALYGMERFEESAQALQAARALEPEDPALARLAERYHHGGLASDKGGGPILPPLWRSALLPGWGQAYNGQKRKGWALGVITVGLFAATAYTYVATDQALADYRGLGPQASAGDFDAAFARADGLAALNQALGISFYAAYAYNLFDAAAGARPPAAPQAGLRLPLLALSF